MSRTIDEKVVEMRFDNSDFERNVSHSMSTLDKLKGALDFSGASKAFDGITSAANKVSFGGLTGALDGVSEKFSALETIATGALLNIGRKVEDFVSNQIKSLTLEPVMEGFDKYASKTSSVQMIMNAIRDGTKSDAELMEEVNGQLERLMWYTDETSYDFTEMTASIGKFTSAGIGLEEAVTAMEGIANLAGISGATKAEANRAMYNISQALSGGFMRLQDWKSIENANMATKEFKEMLIKAAIDRGTLEEAVDEAGNTIWGVSTKSGFNEVNYKTVASTLTEGKWLTNEVLTDTLAMYGAFTDELSKVYDDINENANVTTSQIIKMTNQWKEGTLDMSEAMAMTGKSAEELEAIFASLGRDEYDLGRRAFAAAQEAKTFQEAIDATKDAVSTGWMKTFELLFGNYEEAKVLWTDLANELWDIFAGPISDINDVLTAWRNNDDLGDGRDDLIEGLKNIYRAARSVVDPITEAWKAIFPSATYQDIWNFTHRFREFTDGLIVGETSMKQIKMVFEDFFGIFKTFSTAFKNGGGFGKFFEGISGAFKTGTDRLYDFLLGIQRIRSVIADYESGNLGEFSFVQQTIDAYPAAAKALDIYEKLVKTAETLGQTFGKLFDVTKFFKDGAITIESIIDGIKENIANVLSAITELVHIWTGTDIGKTIGNIRAILFDLFDGVKAFLGSERWSDVKDAVIGIADAFKDTFGPAWQAAVAIFDDWIAGIRTLINGADGDFNGFFDTIVNGANWVADFVRSWKGGVEFISEFLTKFLSLTDAIEVYQANGGGVLGILAVINDKLRIIIDTFADLVQNVTGFDVHGIGDSILGVIQSIGYAILQVADTISKAFGWTDNPFGKLLGQIDSEYAGFDAVSVNFTGVFEKIGEAFSKIGELFNAVAPGIQSALSGVKVVLSDVIQLFKDLGSDMSLPDLLHLVMQIVSVFSGIKLAKKAGEMFEAIGDALNSWQKTLKAQMLLEIAGAIIMIAGAAYLVSKIDNEKIGLVIGTLATAFLGLIGVLAVSKHGNAQNLHALPGIILSVAAAMVALSFATDKLADVMTKFGQISNFWDAFTNFSATLLVISGIIGILAGLNAKLTAKDGLTNTTMINGIVTSIGKLAVSMLLLAGVIKLYEMMDLRTIGEGLAKIIGTLAFVSAAMGGAEFLFNLISTLKGGFTSMESTAASILKFAGAMAVLAAVVGVLTLIKWGDFVSSLGKMIAAVAAFSVALVIFSGALAIVGKLNVTQVLDGVAGAIWKFSKAVALLVIVAGVIGLVSQLFGDSLTEIVDKGLEFIAYAVSSLAERSKTIAYDVATIIMDIIRESMRVIAENAPELGQYLAEILGGLIEGVKEAMTTGGIDIWEAIGGAGLLGGLIGLVAFLKKNKIGVRDFGAAALALAGAALLLAEIGVLFAAMGYAIGMIPGGMEGLQTMKEFSSAIVSVFTDNWGVLAMFGVLMAFELLMAKFGDKWFSGKDAKGKAFGATKGMFKGFLTAEALVISVIGLVDTFGLLLSATGGVIDLLENKVSFIGQGGMVAGIKKAEKFYDAIIGVFIGDEGDENGKPKGGLIGLVIAMAAVLGVLTALHIEGGAGAAWSAFATVWSVIVGVILIIDTMGILFAAVGALIAGIDEWTGKDQAVVDWITQAGNVMEAISVAIGKFAGGFVGGAIQGISENVTEQAVSVVKAMAEVMVAMSEAGLLANLSLFTGGPIGLAAMMSEFGAMGPYFKEFADGIKDIPDDLANKASVCATALAALIASVPTTGGVPAFFKGEKDLLAFGTGIVLLAQGLKNYADTIIGMTEDDLASLDSRSKQIADIVETICSAIPTTNEGWKWFTDGSNDIGTFGTRLESFGLSLVEYSKSVSGDGVKIVAMNNVAGAITKICEYAKNVADLGGEGVARLGTFGNNLSTFGAYFKDYYNSLKDIKIEKVDSISGAVNRMIKSFVGTDDTSTASTVASLTGDFLNKLVTAFGSNDTKKKSDEAADKFIDYFRDRFLWDGTIGKITLAMQNMINKSVYDEAFISGLTTGGKSIVEEIQNGITEAFEGEEGLIAKFTSFLNTLATGIATDGQSGSKKQYYDAGASLVGALRNGMVNEEAVSGFGTPPAKQLKEDFKGLLDSLIGMIVSEEMKGQFQRGGASLINSLVGGMKSVDISTETSGIGKNATIGLGNGMIDESAVAQVKKNAAYVMNTAITTMKNEAQEKSPSKLTALYGWYLDGGLSDGLIDGIPMVVSAVGSVVDETKEAFTKSADQGGFDIHSNSWLTTLFGRFLSGGFADGIIDGIPGVKDAIAKVRAAITDKMGLNDLMNLLHDNGLDALENTFADYVAQFGADFSLDEAMNNFDIQGQMDEFQNEYLSNMNGFNSEYTSFMSGTSTDGMEALTASYSDSSYVADGVSTLMNNTSNAFGSYNDMMGTQGTEGTYSFYNNIGDSAMSAAESITPTVASASQMVADAATAPIEEGIVEILSYVDWLKEAYPEGLTEAFSTPVFDFTELYENMGGGQLEAILNSFDALDETGRKNLIRAYGLGEQGGNEDLANYLTWYWKNEPVRLKNEEAIAQAQAGYQAYLEEQKALQEAQAIQSQQHYEGVQQIAGDMQAHTDEFNAKYMAAIEEIKMSVLSIQEELNGVHADIAELNNMDVYIDSNALVGATADKYNEELGNMAKIGRRNVTR